MRLRIFHLFLSLLGSVLLRSYFSSLLLINLSIPAEFNMMNIHTTIGVLLNRF
ncbi:hypothetical protein RhiirA1_423269 [Rhizophagus irregularis]|uniref:Uncharacterized protein n=2 Tax=Rhizophagus irregularis TaxID=588596 RepID=A0A2I1DZL3_9GLOM|nr:hypothetical protein RhiirA1_423269 [Rhizophagus irregularis]PKY15308.1 hypothetical protein RhiirB3_401425 [Rhizophagus irregularis]